MIATFVHISSYNVEASVVVVAAVAISEERNERIDSSRRDLRAGRRAGGADDVQKCMTFQKSSKNEHRKALSEAVHNLTALKYQVSLHKLSQALPLQ